MMSMNNTMEGLLRKTEKNDWVVIYKNCNLPLHIDDINKVNDVKGSSVYFDIVSNYEINGWRAYAKLIDSKLVHSINFDNDNSGSI